MIRSVRLVQGVDSAAVAGLVDSSVQAGGAVTVSFADGVVNVMLDQSGDWTITAGVSVASDRLMPLTRTLENLGFFQGAEDAGMVYHLWTSALLEDNDGRSIAEETLLRVIDSFQMRYSPSYIG